MRLVDGERTLMPTDTDRTNNQIVVIGAGISGLICAAELMTAGRRVTVFEAGDDVGGRIRTDRHPDGFLLDRGFQVILDGYPAVRRQIDLAALGSAAFDAGAHIWTGQRLVPLADPLRHPTAIVRDLTAPVFPAADQVRLAALAVKTRLSGWQSAADAAGDPASDRSARAYLETEGFSDRFIERFAQPFWGGITLDKNLAGSAGPVRFTLKMFLQGSGVLPADGIGAIAQQIARRLPADSIHLRQPVTALVRENGRVTGVRIEGETIPAAAVVVATDARTSRQLTGIASIPDQGLGCVTVYLAGRRDPGLGARLALDGTGALAINEIAPLSAVQPTYAPAGRHLIAAVMVGDDALADPDDARLQLQARDDVARVLGHKPADWAPLAVARIPFAQFAQPPGIYNRLPSTKTGIPGLYLAGEYTSDSSLNGAIIGGERAARAVIESNA